MQKMLTCTWQISGLGITIAAPTEGSSDSHDECQNRSRNDSLLPTRNELHMSAIALATYDLSLEYCHVKRVRM